MKAEDKITKLYLASQPSAFDQAIVLHKPWIVPVTIAALNMDDIL